MALFKEKNSLNTIGFCILELDNENNSFKLMRLAISKKNQGYGYEVLSAIIDYAFKKINVSYFSLDVYEDNQVAIRLYEKVHLLREGIQQDNNLSSRDDVNLVIYSMSKSKYQGIK